MNKKQAIAINRSLKVMDNSFHYKEGIIKISRHETLKHALAKFLYCFELKKNGIYYYTEVIFKKGKRADIFVPEWNQAIEIMASEQEASIKVKEEEYPVKVKSVKAEDIIKQNGIKYN
tara:strand:+ start:1582 stop:1935 length:354 start_codon:yes stop_codon:yes gene_type:complete